MGGPRSKASREDILVAFQTEETFKAVSARIGMSPNTLRGIWKDAFGEEAFTERGKRLQAKAAAKTCQETAHSRVYKDVTVTCSRCGKPSILKSNQTALMDVATYVCDSCRCDRSCPVCGMLVDGERGLSGHFRHRREAGDAAHVAYQEARGEAQWAGLVQGKDYVVCLICGHRAASLIKHLPADHDLTVAQYRGQYGQDTPIRSQKTIQAMSVAAKNRVGGHGKGDTKRVTCPGCGTVWVGSKFLVSRTHDFRCLPCKQKADDARWVGLLEPEDYVTCLDCGYRAENLTSHVQNAHAGYRDRHPGALMVSLNSAVRDKAAIRGVSRPPEFGQKIREAKLLGFVLEDFTPYLEPDGSVDQRRMMIAVGCAWPTLKGYMDDLGLRATDKYIKQAAKDHRVTLSPDQFDRFKMGNGKVSLLRASQGLHFSFPTVKKECIRLGLRTFNRRIRQTLCLDAISEALGGVPYEQEWKSMRFVNPLTGHRFRFDGYFESIGLICEFFGHQHYTFPNAYMVNESYRPVWDAMRERDRIKREMITASKDLTYFEVQEDEPYTDVAYLRNRLLGLGILEARPGGLWLGDRLIQESAPEERHTLG